MERQFPKNVKQIGNVSDSPRIYVEDYVETFLNQLEEQGREVTITAFLLGEKVQIEGEECIFVTGALQVKDSICLLYTSITEKQIHIFFYGSNSCDSKVLNQHFGNI